MSEASVNINISEWVDLYADALYSYALARVDDPEQAKDFVQETFLAGIKASGNFEGKSSVKTWLISILKRKIIDYYRQKEARKTTPLSHFFSESGKKGHWTSDAAPRGNYSEMEESLDNRELQEAITLCISLLPGKWKGIIIDRLIEEKESDEVCKEHEVSPSNLWVIVHRAKLQLRECLEKKWFNV